MRTPVVGHWFGNVGLWEVTTTCAGVGDPSKRRRTQYALVDRSFTYYIQHRQDELPYHLESKRVRLRTGNGLWSRAMVSSQDEVVASKGKLAMSLAVGSCIQISLFICHLCFGYCSWELDKPLTFFFGPLETLVR